MHGSSRPTPRRGFSLVEMLLAVFILGIGVISIAALFPAGIALQRQAADDLIGPVVAQNAFATIRSKLSQNDFGRFEDFSLPRYTASTANNAGVPQAPGDWGWMRPGFLFGTAANTTDAGTIDVFSSQFTRQNLDTQIPPFAPGNKATEIPGGGELFGIPYNLSKYPLYAIAASGAPIPADAVSQQLIEPVVMFTQAERSFPQGRANYGAPTGVTTVPTYYWDCMFRRNGGKVQVAVFVYRVTASGGEPRPYATASLDSTLIGTPPANSFPAVSDPTQTPPVPALYRAPNLGTNTSWPNRTAAASPLDEIPGTANSSPFGGAAIWDDWQTPGAWLIDNHGVIHRVLVGRRNANDGPVKLTRPIPQHPRAPVYGVYPNGNADPSRFISSVWFVPARDRNGNTLTPVYAAVEEL
jgi:prepilin-type N-terminal cleavage/methylation domain-containing protein